MPFMFTVAPNGNVNDASSCLTWNSCSVTRIVPELDVVLNATHQTSEILWKKSDKGIFAMLLMMKR